MRSLVGTLLNAAPSTKTPVPIVSRAASAFSGWRYNRGATQALGAMEAASVVFGIVDRLATSVSLVDWKLWKKAPSGLPEDRVEVTSHLALDILNSPNEFYSRAELMEAAQQHQELTGESWLVVSRNPRARSIPLELWPVRPDRMEPVPSAESYIAGYEYRAPDGECVPLKKDEILFVRRPDPNNPYRGLGPIRSTLTDIDSIRFSMEWNKNFFVNGAEPGGIVEIDRRLSEDEFNELVARWREQHQGTSNAHRVAILEQVKWVDRKYTMRDMQFTELRGVTEAGIKLAFGFPKFALGEVDDVNRAQGEASIAMYAQWLIVPRLERWKGVFNRRFLPMFGTTASGLEFDYVSPVSEDTETENASRTSRVQAVASLVPLGFDAKKALEVFGLPDIPFEKPEPPAPAPGQLPPGGKPGKKQDPLQALLAPTLQDHLPGRHDQKTHGRRKPRMPDLPDVSSLGARVATGELSRVPLGGGQWAQVDLVELGDGSRAVRKAQLKPIEGRPAREVQDAEQLGAVVLRAFGISAPQTHRASARVVYQEYMEGTLAETLPKRPSGLGVEGPYYDSDQGRLLGLADALMYNYDRRSANWLVASDGSPVGIDHGMAFAWNYHKPGSPHTHGFDGDSFWDYLTRLEPGKGFVWADNDLSPRDIETARGVLRSLQPEFERLNRGEWLDNMLVTLDAIEPHAKGSRVRFQ